MATCGSLRHILDSTIPENSSSPASFIDSLSSFKQIKPNLDHSFTEIFGELHFKETPNLFSPSSPWQKQQSSISKDDCRGGKEHDGGWGNVTSLGNNSGYHQGSSSSSSYHRTSDSFSSLNSESLQLCTEGLGSESLDDAEGLKVDQVTENTCQDIHKNDYDKYNNNETSYRYSYRNYNRCKMVNVRGFSGDPYRKRKTNGKTFPPPISCLGRTGKPSVCFQSYRQDGRFVLKEIRIPTHERLHASREDGRLRLCFVQPAEQDDDGGGSEVVADEENNEGEEEGAVEKIEEDEERGEIENSEREEEMMQETGGLE